MLINSLTSRPVVPFPYIEGTAVPSCSAKKWRAAVPELGHLGYLESQIREFGQRIRHRLEELFPASVRERLDGIPGVNQTTIENVLAEIGVDMTVFPDEHHLASWWEMKSRRAAAT
jgi:transposase